MNRARSESSSDRSEVKASLLTIKEVVDRARSELEPHIWDYSCGGADSETTLRRNRSAFDHVAFNPRVLGGKGRPSLSTTFLGHRLELPIMLAPVGSIGHFHTDGALACARTAERAGTAAFVGTLASPPLEEVRAGTGGMLFFQLYVYGDRHRTEQLVKRAELAGYSGICVTVDLAAYGRRERDLHNRFSSRESVGRPNLDPGKGADSTLCDTYNARFSWGDVAWLRELTDLPIILKGILNARDAELAAEFGADVVYVSNHGGRQLDHAPAAIEILPEIVEAARGRVEVVVDSGFMRGTDVIKALAMGAKAVAIGKLMVWGLAAGGEDGLLQTLGLLESEMSSTMANVGAGRVADLCPETLRSSFPPSHSSWPVEQPGTSLSSGPSPSEDA